MKATRQTILLSTASIRTCPKADFEAANTIAMDEKK
jgi:hypothetical protein